MSIAIAFVTETFPPEVNGVAMTVARLVEGLQQLRADHGIAYEHRTGGTLQLFRTQAQVDAAQRDIAVLKENNVPYELLTAEQLASVEPGLAQARNRLAGGLRLPMDERLQSYNTSVAASLALYEAVRQRGGINFQDHRATKNLTQHLLVRSGAYLILLDLIPATLLLTQFGP